MFKQIISRGTRLFPDRSKKFFTIMDFRGATDKFYDPDFDGDPEIILSDSPAPGVKKNSAEIDYTRKNILGRYADLRDFLQDWNAADKKQTVLQELTAEGIFLPMLRDAYKFDKNIDDFDLILHVTYGQKLKTRRQRSQSANNSAELKQFPEKCRAVLDALLDKYSTNGIDELENLQVLKNAPFDSFGSPKNIVDLFGGKQNYLQAVRQLKNLIYRAA